MAIIYRCDRCGVDFTVSSSLGTVCIPDWRGSTPLESSISKYLCRNCVRIIEEALKPPAKQMPVIKEFVERKETQDGR